MTGTALSIASVLAQNGGNEGTTDTIFWTIAAVLVVIGIVTIVRGAVLWGSSSSSQGSSSDPAA